MRWIARIALALGALVLAAVLIAGGYMTWRVVASQPLLEGETSVPGLPHGAEIVRDAHGVAHVFGRTDEDVYFALGYAHASDRFFQMDLARRYVQGRLAEVFGPDYVRADARSRIRGYPDAAERVAANASDEVRAAVDAYSNGVNAWLATRPGPPEHLLLRAAPEPWRSVDSASIVIYLGDMLAAGETEDLTMARLSQVLDEDALAEFLIGYPDWGPTTLKDVDIARVQAARALEQGVGALAPSSPTPSRTGGRAEDAPGSNAWAVSGARSETGAPLLANDPHLGLGAPSIWHFARLNLSFGPVIGGAIPGAPFIVLGRNAHGAWGYTNTGFKVIDLIERDTDDPALDIAERVETIRIKGAAPVQIRVRESRLGPVLDPDWFDLTGFAPERLVILRGTVTHAGNRGADASLAIMKSESWDEFVEAGRMWTAPMQNMHYAGVDGTIGYTTAGLLPLRDEAGEWTGFVPFDDLPRIADPAGGLIASGNNRVAGDLFDYPLDGRFEVYRASRIEALIEARPAHDAPSFAAIQMDVVSDFFARIRPALMTAEPETAPGEQALARLADWRGELDAQGPEGLIASAWLSALGPAIWADELGEAARYFRQPRRIFLESVLMGENAHWCDDIATPQIETCPEIAGRALDAAMEQAAAAHGPDMDDWRWGEVHPALFAHPFSALPVIGERYTVRAPMGGDGSTVNVGHFNPARGYEAIHGASMRAIYDLSDLNESLYIHAPGQSGHPLSPHYRDLTDKWARGGYIQIRDDWGVEDAPSGARTLSLRPAQ